MIVTQNAYSTASHSVPSLVSTQFLATHNTGRGPNDLDIAVLDGSWHMPQSGRDPKQEFLERHIPGARFFGIDDIKDHTTVLPHMLPTSESFAEAVSDLGITNTDHVIIYDTVNTFSAARVYWTFKAFGHNKVSVLNGGLPKWIAEGGELEGGEARVKAKKYQPTFINTALLRDYNQIVQNVRAVTSGAEHFQVVDARPARRFTGADPEPRPGLSSGHMPGSISIPFGEVLDPATGEMLEADSLRRVFKAKGLDLTRQEIVASCGSGITASILYLALERAGAKRIAVYDGSWTEYAGKSVGEGTVIVREGGNE